MTAAAAGVAAALVATEYTPGRAKTTAATTMRSRRYNDGLPIAVGFGGKPSALMISGYPYRQF